jgi:hypothetical protein
MSEKILPKMPIKLNQKFAQLFIEYQINPIGIRQTNTETIMMEASVLLKCIA